MEKQIKLGTKILVGRKYLFEVKKVKNEKVIWRIGKDYYYPIEYLRHLRNWKRIKHELSKLEAGK